MVLIISAYFFLNIIIKLISLIWVSRFSSRIPLSINRSYEHCSIIVPVYDEVDVVVESAEFFSRMRTIIPNLQIIYVGTSRERQDGVNMTLRIIEPYCQDNELICIEAPSVRHYMAGQINYALEYIKQDCPEIRYFALYNVDSRPDASDVMVNFDKLDKCDVVQQYGSYLLNYPVKLTKWLDYLYANIFLWQTSWAIQFERRNILVNNLLPRLMHKFSYVVGHGMYMRLSCYDRIGAFSESFQNEDMEYSCRLHRAGIRIGMGVGDSPCTMPLNLSDYIRQQSVWARGPLLAFSYVRGKGPYSNFIAAKLFMHFLYWLLEPVAFFVLILCSLHSIQAFGYALIIILCHGLVIAILPNWRRIPMGAGGINLLLIGLAYPVFFILHGIGPLITLCKLNRKDKYKTRKALYV